MKPCYLSSCMTANQLQLRPIRYRHNTHMAAPTELENARNAVNFRPSLFYRARGPDAELSQSCKPHSSAAIRGIDWRTLI
jgi:hypothetical protein